MPDGEVAVRGGRCGAVRGYQSHRSCGTLPMPEELMHDRQVDMSVGRCETVRRRGISGVARGVDA